MVFLKCILEKGLGYFQHIIFRSAVRSAHHSTPNLHHELPSGESTLPNSNPSSHKDSPYICEQSFLWSQSECEDNSSLNPNPTPMATFNVDDLIGRSILLPSGQDPHKPQLSRKLRNLTKTQPTGENTSNFSSSSTTRKMLNRLPHKINFLITLKRMNHS